MTEEKNISTSSVKIRLQSYQNVTKFIIDGLNGKPFSWSWGELDAYKKKAEKMGVTLVTKTQVKKLGRKLRPRAKPIGNGYYLAPISRSANLYVLECQTLLDEKDGEE